MSSPKRSREPVDLPNVIDLSKLSRESDEAEQEQNKTYKRLPRRTRRKIDAKVRRIRQHARKNVSLSCIDVLQEILLDPAFFSTAATLLRPAGQRGPDRQYNEIQFYLYQRMIEHIPSIRQMESFFAHPLIHRFICFTLEHAWPDHPDRRIRESPMSRSQYHHHRHGLGPEAIENAFAEFERCAAELALAMGYCQPGSGSLAVPDPTCIARGDGTFIKAMFDAILGDLVYDPRTGALEQPRYDPDGFLGKDDDGNTNPGYKWVVFHVANALGIEQESVILSFARAKEGGEAAAAPALLERIKEHLPAIRHYLYDMALQGTAIDRLYKSGLHPMIKIARLARGRIRSALVEVQEVEGSDGVKRKVQIYGVDGPAYMTAHANGRDVAVALNPMYLRERGDGRVYGEYEIPDNPVVHTALRGRRILVRLDGDTVKGRKRAQVLRWINEHTHIGEALLGQRSTTEAENSSLEKILGPGERARSVGEPRNTLDLIGYYQTRNLKAALAYRRRTGRDPVGLGPPPPFEELLAA